MYNNLSDFPTLTGGDTEVWYYNKDFARDASGGYDFLKKFDKLPTADNLSETHTLLGKIGETDLEKIFALLQGHNWSPEGEAYDFIDGKDLTHTSISIGDIIVKDGKTYLVDFLGFKELN